MLIDWSLPTAGTVRTERLLRPQRVSPQGLCGSSHSDRSPSTQWVQRVPQGREAVAAELPRPSGILSYMGYPGSKTAPDSLEPSGNPVLGPGKSASGQGCLGLTPSEADGCGCSGLLTVGAASDGAQGPRWGPWLLFSPFSCPSGRPQAKGEVLAHGYVTP